MSINFNKINEDEFQQLKLILEGKLFLEIKIVSSSMFPLMKIDEKLKVYKIDSDLKKFDIIIFLRDFKLVAHYIWRINRLGGVSYTTRSLECPDFDEIPVKESELLGIINDKKISFLNKVKLEFKYD